jgi:nucleotide-binding universal stress UspA family protein
MSSNEVLIGYEPAHRADDVLALGRLFADALGARPVVITARPWPNQLDDPETQQQRVDDSLREDFAVVRHELEGFDPDIRAIVSAYPGLTLNDFAERSRDTRLIVLGSSHHGPIGRTLLGGVGESLLHGAPCAVAVAPRGYGERSSHRLRKIGVAIDDSDESRTALHEAIGLARRCRAELTLLAVADYPHYGYSTTWAVLTAGEVTDADRRRKEKLLEEAAARVPAGLSCEKRVLVGKPGRELAEASGDFDLMVVGSRAYGPVRRTLLGSTTRKLLEHSHCPVLVLPRGAGSDPLALDQVSPRAISEALGS